MFKTEVCLGTIWAGFSQRDRGGCLAPYLACRLRADAASLRTALGVFRESRGGAVAVARGAV